MIATARVRLSKKLSVDFEFDSAANRFNVIWDPAIPARVTASERRAYRRGRDAFVAEVGERLGGAVLVVEVAV